MSLEIDIAGETVRLLSQRALYWPSARTLMVADLHLGKDHVFGRQGVAIPGGSSEGTLARLDTALRCCDATRLYILGDLVHAPPGPEESWLHRLSEFLDGHAGLEITVITGNHDRQTERALLDTRLAWCDQPLPLGPFVLQHEPPPPLSTRRSANKPLQRHIIAGHLHPVYRLRGSRAEPGMRLPVFHVTPHYTVLPALGYFTGGTAVRADFADRLYLIAEHGIRAVPRASRSSTQEVVSDV